MEAREILDPSSGGPTLLGVSRDGLIVSGVQWYYLSGFLPIKTRGVDYTRTCIDRENKKAVVNGMLGGMLATTSLARRGRRGRARIPHIGVAHVTRTVQPWSDCSSNKRHNREPQSIR